MSAPPAAAASTEAAYFQTVEEFFVSRRGDPLFLSNADWLLVKKWREAGIPLRIVLRGITDALDSHAHSWGRARKVGSLAYCAAEVETARERWQRALAYDGQERLGAGEFLRRLAESLAAAATLGPAAAGFARALAGVVEERSREPVEAPALDRWLREQEQKLLAAIDEDDSGGLRRLAESEVDESLRPYRERMPPKVLAKVREESVARRILERCSLPRLSLLEM